MTATRTKGGTVYEIENVGFVSATLIKTAIRNGLLEDGEPGLLEGLPQSFKVRPGATWPPKTWPTEDRDTSAVAKKRAAWSQEIRQHLAERSS